MKVVYSNQNKILVENARNLLAHNGISSILKNEFASGALGELSAIDTWPELWVTDGDYDSASALVSTLAADPEGQPWLCDHCGEQNEASFDMCWHCNAEPLSRQ